MTNPNLGSNLEPRQALCSFSLKKDDLHGDQMPELLRAMELGRSELIPLPGPPPRQ